jgi:hypothetical protein
MPPFNIVNFFLIYEFTYASDFYMENLLRRDRRSEWYCNKYYILMPPFAIMAVNMGQRFAQHIPAIWTIDLSNSESLTNVDS